MSRVAANPVLRWIPAVLWMGLIFFLSSRQNLATDLGFGDLVLRKLAHMTEYAVLTVLFTWAIRPRGVRGLALPMALALAYAGTDEFHQTRVNTRHGSPIDVLIDLAGILAAGWAIARYDRRVLLRRPKYDT